MKMARKLWISLSAATFMMVSAPAATKAAPRVVDKNFISVS